ncbi:MAG: hypothetical protein RMH97_11065 [Verrucomicrobiales bacterium]|nr:hypothetical protein [Verrucomicrobiales bacterium]
MTTTRSPVHRTPKRGQQYSQPTISRRWKKELGTAVRPPFHAYGKVWWRLEIRKFGLALELRTLGRLDLFTRLCTRLNMEHWHFELCNVIDPWQARCRLELPQYPVMRIVAVCLGTLNRDGE